MAGKIPPCPVQLKALQHYLKLASYYETRDSVITYWGRIYSLQKGLEIDRKSSDAKALLGSLMDWLETYKKSNIENEAITSNIAGQAQLENEAHRLFIWADGEDRAARFTKNVVKSFYTAGIIFDVCEVFGELSEEATRMRKYAKWKATYIHNCLRSGQQPVPGPAGGEEEGFEDDFILVVSESQKIHQEEWTHLADVRESFSLGFNVNQDFISSVPQVQPSADASHPPGQLSSPAPAPAPACSGGRASLTPEVIEKAQKHCKWAVSALDYEDAETALKNLQEAVALLSGRKCST